MNKQQKLERLKKEGYVVHVRAFRTLKYVAIKKGQQTEAKSINGLFKTIFGY